MIKYSAILVLISLWFIQPAQGGRATEPVRDGLLPEKAELLSFTGMLKENRIHLKWIVSHNNLVDRFEIEKSGDKKKFSLAALVFCTDEMEIDHYKFTDSSNGKKVYYRVKLINKDGSVVYSSSLEIDPSAKPEPNEQTKTTTYDHYC